MSASPCELAARDDQILVPNRLTIEPAFQNFTGPCRVTSLRRKRSSRRVRGHAVMRHRAPRMIRRRGLGIPDVARVAGKTAGFECADDRVAIANIAARGID